jgi:hypothetical protein
MKTEKSLIIVDSSIMHVYALICMEVIFMPRPCMVYKLPIYYGHIIIEGQLGADLILGYYYYCTLRCMYYALSRLGCLSIGEATMTIKKALFVTLVDRVPQFEAF